MQLIIYVYGDIATCMSLALCPNCVLFSQTLEQQSQTDDWRRGSYWTAETTARTKLLLLFSLFLQSTFVTYGIAVIIVLNCGCIFDKWYLTISSFSLHLLRSTLLLHPFEKRWYVHSQSPCFLWSPALPPWDHSLYLCHTPSPRWIYIVHMNHTRQSADTKECTPTQVSGDKGNQPLQKKKWMIPQRTRLQVLLLHGHPLASIYSPSFLLSDKS